LNLEISHIINEIIIAYNYKKKQVERKQKKNCF